MTARISTADPLRERLYWHRFALEPKDAGWSLYDLVRGEPWPFAAVTVADLEHVADVLEGRSTSVNALRARRRRPAARGAPLAA
jgi:hypothetical protein